MEIALAISILSVIITVCNFVVNRKDKAVQDTKESTKENHQPLIEYQLKEIKEDNKEIKNDLKEIRRVLNTYKDTIRDMIKSEIEEHIRIYHSKEN